MKKQDAVDRFIAWLLLESRKYSSSNIYKMKIVLDEKKLKHRIRALVRGAEKKALLWAWAGDVSDIRVFKDYWKAYLKSKGKH